MPLVTDETRVDQRFATRLSDLEQMVEGHDAPDEQHPSGVNARRLRLKRAVPAVAHRRCTVVINVDTYTLRDLADVSFF